MQRGFGDLCAPSHVVHQFFSSTKRGNGLLQEAGLAETIFHVDHIFPSSLGSVGIGLDHVGNYFLLSKQENEFFGARGDIWQCKIDNMGSIAKHAALALQAHIHMQLKGRGGDGTRNLELSRCDMLSAYCLSLSLFHTPQTRPLFAAALEQVENSLVAFAGCARQRQVDLFS